MTDTDLTAKTCQPCNADTPALEQSEIDSLLEGLDDWRHIDGHIERRFVFANYYETIAFVNAVAWIAHREGHHPDLDVGYKSCTVTFTTHAIDGLSDNDFICAAKVNQLSG